MNSRNIFFGLLLFLATTPLFSQDFQCSNTTDNRTKVTSLNAAAKYSSFMIMKRGSRTNFGTGFLIHPRVVLTAGHNIARYPFRKVKEVSLFFGATDSSNQIAKVVVKPKKNVNSFHINGYWHNKKIHRDFGILILPDSTVYKKVEGHFVIKPLAYDQLPMDKLTMTGYPCDKPKYEMWTETTDDFTGWNSASVRYNLLTKKRNSGSPVWFENEQGKPQIIGVHSRVYNGNCKKVPGVDCPDCTGCGGAVLINEKVYQQIKEWCAKAGISLD